MFSLNIWDLHRLAKYLASKNCPNRNESHIPESYVIPATSKFTFDNLPIRNFIFRFETGQEFSA